MPDVPRELRVNPRMEQFRDLIYRYKDRLAAVLPKHVTVEQIAQLGLVAMARDSKVLACTPASVLRVLTQASQLGLDPTGVGGEAWVLPFGTTATLVVGYKGLLQLARRSGLVTGVDAHVVHLNDRFELQYGINPVVVHEPIKQGEPGPVIGAYAIVRIRGDQAPLVEWMTKVELDRIRSRSRSGASGPWQSDTEQMYRKSVLRRVLNYAPSSRELQQAMAVEDRQESWREGDTDPRPESDTSDILPFPSLEDQGDPNPPMSKSDEIARRVTHTTGETTEPDADQEKF